MAGYFGYNMNQGQGQRPPAAGPWGGLVRGIQSGRRGIAQGSARRAAIGEGIRRFEAIGTDEATRVAELMRENPQGASVYADTFGGWEKLYNQTKSGALQQQAAQARAKAFEGAPGSADFYSQNPGMLEEAQAIAEFEKTQAQTGKLQTETTQMGAPGPDPTRETKKDVNGRWRYTDTGEFVFGGVEKTGPEHAPGSAWKLQYDDEGKLVERYIEPGTDAVPRGGDEFMVQLPDGTMVRQGPTGPQDNMTRRARGIIESEISTFGDAIARITSIRDNYDESALEHIPKITDAIRRQMWKLGYRGGDEETMQDMSDRTVFRATVLDNVNRTIQEITGAQMNAEEAKRIIPTQPNLSMSGPEFKSMIELVEARLQDHTDRRQYLLNNGIIDDSYNVLEEEERGNKPIMSIDSFRFKKEKAGKRIRKKIAKENPGLSSDQIDMMTFDELDREHDTGVKW